VGPDVGVGGATVTVSGTRVAVGAMLVTVAVVGKGEIVEGGGVGAGAHATTTSVKTVAKAITVIRFTIFPPFDWRIISTQELRYQRK
jgi:hypothetical protein